MAVQFLESVDAWDKIAAPATSMDEVCWDWNAYYPEHAAYLRESDESGI